jgi:two-component system LytT family response regulator
MKVIIIEDESIAIRRLRKLVKEINPEIEIIAELESVYEAKKWFNSNSLLEIDLLFSDIQLSDGLSFEIFENLDSKLPIIFTTAYDEYALNAFKLNGVDYLLKPIQKEELKKAIIKFQNVRQHYSNNQMSDIRLLINQFKNPVVIFPNFLCYQKDKILPISSENVSVFYIKNQY